MSKEENLNFLKIQTCVLRVNIHCDGCKKKVKKLLQKIEGVYTTTIDAEQGKVTVSGNVDPATLIKKLSKAGKHAELLAPKGSNNNKNNNSPHLLNAQFQKLQVESGKGQQKESGKPQMGGGGGGGGGKEQKGQQPRQQQLQNTKWFKDLKLPQLKDLKFPFQKDPKSVKFSLPSEDRDHGSDSDDDDDFDDDDDDDYDDFDDMDGIDDDFDDDLKDINMKHMNDKKGWGEYGKKGGGGDIQVQNKGMSGNNGGKKCSDGGGGPKDNKNEGNSNKGAPNGNGNGNGGHKSGKNNNLANGGKKGGGKNDVVGGGQPMSNPKMMGQNFQGIDLGGDQMGKMMHAPMGPMGSIPAAAAVQGLPTGAPPGYFQGGMLVPEMIANPYQQQQQQYMAAMMQQRMMMNGHDRPFHPVVNGHPMGYMPPPPAYGDPYNHFFSDENANSCSIM